MDIVRTGKYLAPEVEVLETNVGAMLCTSAYGSGNEGVVVGDNSYVDSDF